MRKVHNDEEKTLYYTFKQKLKWYKQNFYPRLYLIVVVPIVVLKEDELCDPARKVDQGVREVPAVQRLIRAMQSRIIIHYNNEFFQRVWRFQQKFCSLDWLTLSSLVFFVIV